VVVEAVATPTLSLPWLMMLAAAIIAIRPRLVSV
jgi:hypothetical protein